MRQRYSQFNTKRRFRIVDEAELERLHLLAGRVSYGGNPEHKRNPGDFGLTPPGEPGPQNG